MIKMIELENYKSNLDVIDKNDLKNIKIDTGKVYTGKTKYINPQIKEIEHTSPLLAAAILGLDNTGAPIPENSKYFDIWTDIDAQEKYINTKPTCYIILGKPGAGSFDLGEAMAKKYNIIHLCPRNILLDEISQKSITGRTWDFNMKKNKVCFYDMILTMLKIKLNSEVVQHRGYVISGLPLVTAYRSPLCYINTLHGEESLLVIEEILLDIIRNLKKKKLKSPRSVSSSASSEMHEEEKEEEEASVQEEEALEEEEDKPAELPTFLLDTCSNVIINKKPHFESKLAALLGQLDELFNLFLKPDIIIHITCPELDVMKIKGNSYINYKTGMRTNQPFISTYKPEPSWPRKCSTDDYKNPHTSNIFNPKYNCKPPSHYEDKIIEQICNYKTYVYPYIEKKLKDFDPKMIIELDGRTTCSQMLNHVAETLILIPIPPVLIPQPLFLQEYSEEMEEFWETTVAGLDVTSNNDVNFKYYASPWFNRCPVELKFRRTVAGTPKYAVRFFKHVYLMSSLNNFIAFYRNPRPYLKLKYLEPICRVIVTGTKSSGKTMISQCLSWLFDAPILNFKTILETEKEKKFDRTAPTILSEIIATIEDARFQAWEAIETDRITKLDDWFTSTRKLLKKYIPLLTQVTAYNAKMLLKKQREAEKAAEKKRLLAAEKEKLRMAETENLEESEKDLKGVEEEEELKETSEKEVKTVDIEEEKSKMEVEIEEIEQLDNLKTKLSFLPILDNIEECQKALKDDYLSQFAPIELLTATNKPTIPVLGDDDVTIAVTKYIEANELQKELEPTTEELMTEIIKLITAIDTQHQIDTQSEQLYGKYIIDGFPSDPEYWEYISNAKFSPDYTIGLIENRDIDDELYQYYSSSDKETRSYWENILLVKDPLIHTKLQTTKIELLQNTTLLNTQNIINDIITEMLDLTLTTKIKSTTTNEPSRADVQSQFIASFTEAIEKYREDWDSLKLKIEDQSKCYIEIELGNKTDMEVIEEMLRKLRQCYRPTRVELQDEDALIPEEDEKDPTSKDLLTFNDNRFLCETNIYCPIAYHDHNILWEGNPEFSLKCDNKLHYFCKEEFLELFQKDITKYQFYNVPFKKLPKLKICVIGSIGCGATSLSKYIAKELGLLHIDFAHIINEYLVPKHFKKIGRHYENMFVDGPIDEEGVVEFQLDEENVNLVSDILANEKDLTRMLYDYFERGTPILSKLMQKIILKIWYDSSSPVGFVLDGFPKTPNDVEDMLACYAIPDVVIQLDNNAETAINRIGPIMTKSWKSQQNEAKQVAAAKLDIERKLWLHSITKEIVAKLIIEEVYEKIFFLKPEPFAKSNSADSVIMDAHPSGTTVDPVLFQLYNSKVEQYPEPQDTNVWEKMDEAQERIESRIEGIFDTEDENIQSLNEILLENRIKIISVDASKPFKKVTKYTLSKLSYLKNRCESFFEQTFIVDVDVAEKLLSRGFYFFSKFHRLCPVYIFENPLAVQNSYKICKRKGTLFPIIHRSFIYFISSKDNVTKFRKNPLKYITSDAIKSYFEFPLRIGVIGTPKSGQSTLAARLVKQYGLLCISGGSAVRTILENFHWTELANEMRKCLKEGKTIEEDHIVKAMQTVAINPRTVTCGYVLDGAPVSPYRAKGHVKSFVFPNIIFDICSHRSRILENSQNEIYYDILKYMPPYPHDLIQIRYENWERRHHKIKGWIAENYQNLHPLDGNQSKWHIIQQANDHINLLTSKLHYYVSNVDDNIVRAMWISDEAFQARQSQYKNICPVCFHKKVYRYMGTFFGGKTGVVQYQNKFYWICSEHMDLVMAFPNSYLTSADIEIPEMPALINIINLDYIYENGICVVTYAENLPAQILKIGTNQYAASYAGKSYLFCSKACLCKFISKPYLFKDITIFKESKNFPKLSLKSLPNIGYLEQTLGNMLTEACCSVNAFRPKYPGLSFQTSAFIYIALYLKTHNPLTDKNKMPMYLKAFRIFEARCKLMLNVGLRLRSMDNPFASYPKCLHREPTLNPAELCPTSSLCSAQLIKEPSIVPKRNSNYVQMHKPSYLQKFRKRSTAISQMERQ